MAALSFKPIIENFRMVNSLKITWAFDGHGNVVVIIFPSIIARYFFASGSAYIAMCYRYLPVGECPGTLMLTAGTVL